MPNTLLTSAVSNHFDIAGLIISKTGITSKHDVVESFVNVQIANRLKRLRAKFNLCQADADDLKQDFLLSIVHGIKNYDHMKGLWRVFVMGILDRCYCNMLRQMDARFRLSIRNTASIDDFEDDDTLTPQYSEDIDTPVDVAAIIAGIPPKLRHVAKLLQEYSAAEAARQLGVGKATVSRRMDQIREYFRAAGYIPLKN